MQDRILIGIGGNLPGEGFANPRETLEAAVEELSRRGIRIQERSGWYESAPVPASDQPWYVNGVLSVASALAPEPLLAELHRLEADFGRVRGTPNAARMLDLDLLAYGAQVIARPGGLVLPHPRLAERAFVLLPLREVAPDWHHPVTGAGLSALIAQLPPGQTVRPLA